MAPTITFASARARVAFGSMAEGMWEVARDDGETARADALERLAEAAWSVDDGGPYPATVQIGLDDAEHAVAVVENCLDNGADDPESEDGFAEGEVTVDAF